MGLDRTVAIAGPGPDWSRLAAGCAGRGVTLGLRMIDGLPAFPDETPPDEWRELRVSTPAGMVTLRRVPEGVQLVTWGNAEPALLAARDVVAEVLAAG